MIGPRVPQGKPAPANGPIAGQKCTNPCPGGRDSSTAYRLSPRHRYYPGPPGGFFVDALLPLYPLLPTMRRSLLLSLAALLGLAGSARAQAPSNTERLFVQATLDGMRLHFDEDNFDESDEGGSLNLRVGYGISRVVTLFAGASGSRMDGENNGLIDDDYGFGVGEIGARFHFGAERRALVPYLEVGLQGAAATYEDDFDLEFRGGALGLGGGLAYYVSEPLALDVGLRFAGGAFDEVDLGGVAFDLDEDDFGFGVSRLTFGISWYPFR